MFKKIKVATNILMDGQIGTSKVDIGISLNCGVYNLVRFRVGPGRKIHLNQPYPPFGYKLKNHICML